MQVSSSYESVILGVSEQTPHSRKSGQMQEQVNMRSDPVRGVTRLHGSVFQAEKYLGTKMVNTSNMVTDTNQFITVPYMCDGVEYDILYARKPLLSSGLNEIYCYNKETKTFLNVVGTGVVYSAIQSGGVSAVANVGRLALIAARGYTPTYQTNQLIEADTAAKGAVVWVRNGDYSRTYRISYTKTNGTTGNVTYTTPASSYPNALNTSSVTVPTINITGSETTDQINQKIATFNSQMATYNQQVANITNAYNSAVTSWVGTAAAAIQPGTIATQLASALNSALGAGSSFADGPYVYINTSAGVKAAIAYDGGDNTYMKMAISSTDKPENLTPAHFYGKIVKIVSSGSTDKDSYYMKAVAKNTSDGRTYGDVIWRECAGIETQPLTAFAIGQVSGNTLYIGSTPAELDTLLGTSGTPVFKPSSAGNQVSSVIPLFLTKAITYLGVFQDRLLIGYGATVFASRTGDYFNWFRYSVLADNKSDPIEMYALGTEDDIIRWDTTFDRNHVMFGEKYQYMIPGRSQLLSTNPTIQKLASVEDATGSNPCAAGNFVFYGKVTDTKGSIHQLQIGLTSDSSESYECSQQLDKYLKGMPIQILCNTAPFVVLTRTESYPYGVFEYSYRDSMGGGERLYDSWSRWEWDSSLGPCMGMSRWKGNVLMYTLRNTSTGLWLVCDQFTFDTALPDTPYLNSQFPLTDIPGWFASDHTGVSSVGYSSDVGEYMLGSPYETYQENIPEWEASQGSLYVGINQSAYVTLTSPYVRDRNDKAKLTGRLTVSRIAVAVSDSGGIIAEVQTASRLARVTDFNGRLLSRTSNKVGIAPIVTTVVPVPVGRETREYLLTLRAKTWLPLTISSIEWRGQWFGYGG